MPKNKKSHPLPHPTLNELNDAFKHLTAEEKHRIISLALYLRNKRLCEAFVFDGSSEEEQ